MRVLVFARLREIVGSAETSARLQAGARIEDLWASLEQRYPALAAERSCSRAARNGSIAPFSTALDDGDEVALLPPVGGG